MEYMPLDLKIAIVCVFVQVALTLYAVLRMGIVRPRQIRKYDINLGKIAVDNSNYLEEARKYANNLMNQFEFPILLYMGVLLAVMFDVSSMPFALCCVAYVITRYFHRFIHVHSNRVSVRFKVFLAKISFLTPARRYPGLGLFGVTIEQ